MEPYKLFIVILFFISACGGSLDQTENNSQSHYEKGISALQKKNYLAAEKELKLALQKSNRNVFAYNALGEVYFNWGRLDEAQDNYDNALKIDPNFVPALVGLAKMELKKSNNKKASSMLQESFQITKDNAEAHYVMGLIYLTENKSGLATQEFQKTLNINPAHAAAQLKLKEARITSDYKSNLSHKKTITRAELASFLVNSLNIKDWQVVHEIQIKDIKNQKSEKEIRHLVNLHVMEAPNQKFHPKTLIIKSDLAQIGQALIIRSTGDLSLKTTFSQILSPFSDVHLDDHYYNAVILSTSYGLLETPSDGKFHPNFKVTGKDVTQFTEKVKQFIGN